MTSVAVIHCKLMCPSTAEIAGVNQHLTASYSSVYYLRKSILTAL
jgi:hypothetical protein